jgi:MFS family permease
MEHRSPFPLVNARLFVLFRIFFNCRFYYPVYFILFLDFGLGVDAFTTLNLIWAVAIVLLEVPSGALADQLGRKTLVVAASVFMILEMLVLCLTPVGGGGIVFVMFLINRILSGAAEAAASGADEALAYDSLPKAERSERWPKIMRSLMVWMSVGFVLSSVVGAAVYSADFVNGVLGWFGLDLRLDKTTTVKFPLYLNLVTACGALVVSLMMKEPPPDPEEAGLETEVPRHPLIASFIGMGESARWILRTPPALVLVLYTLFYDSLVRLFYTVASNVYRLLEIPEKVFGLIGASVSLLGIVTAGLGERMLRAWSPSANFAFVTFLVFAGCLALAHPVPRWGVALLLPMLLSMRFLQYFGSHYLNAITPSARRATILSFRGLATNVAFGIVTKAFGSLTAGIKGALPASMEDGVRQQAAFAGALEWLPWYFGAVAVGLFLFVRIRFRTSLNGLIRER